MFDAYEPYTSESPIAIFTASATGARTLKMDSTYSSNLLSKANANNVYTKTQADTRTQEIFPWLVGDPADYNTISTTDIGLAIRYGENIAMVIKGAGSVGNEGKAMFYGDALFYQDVDMSRTLTTRNLKIKGPSGGGCVRCIPLSDDTEASIGFYKYTDERSDNAGDVWVAGFNAWSRSGYTIGTAVKDWCLQVNDEGNIICHYDLIVNGNILAANSNPYWIAAKVGFNGSVKTNSGRYNITSVSKLSSDSAYDITFPAHPLGANAVVFICASEFTSFYRTQTSNSIRVYTRGATNVPGTNTDYDFNIFILA
jgi:hypothetical protein